MVLGRECLQGLPSEVDRRVEGSPGKWSSERESLGPQSFNVDITQRPPLRKVHSAFGFPPSYTVSPRTGSEKELSCGGNQKLSLLLTSQNAALQEVVIFSKSVTDSITSTGSVSVSLLPGSVMRWTVSPLLVQHWTVSPLSALVLDSITCTWVSVGQCHLCLSWCWTVSLLPGSLLDNVTSTLSWCWTVSLLDC